MVPGDQPAPSDDHLWRHASRELPRPAVPARFFVVDELPMTGNAKVGYSALTRLAGELSAGSRDTAATAATSDDPPGLLGQPHHRYEPCARHQIRIIERLHRWIRLRAEREVPLPAQSQREPGVSGIGDVEIGPGKTSTREVSGGVSAFPGAGGVR